MMKSVSYATDLKLSIDDPHMIRILDEITINQIAAGEVIEMSASVVKELVENALDAGATALTVETQGAGRQRIIVKDNGCGMEEDDLLLCIERYATSKIQGIDDIYRLHTLGFRGEALSSIASVSRLQIHSCKAHQGKVLHVEGGKVHSLKELPRRQGTTVEVSSLFFNVPARRKFQKSLASDTAEIRKVLIHTALCYPKVALTWISEGKEEFALSNDMSLRERLTQLLGNEFTGSLLPVEELQGFIGLPAAHRPNRMGQYLFINRRPVFSSFISKVVSEAYGERLPEGRFPLFVLHLTCDPAWIDVNVHPRKLEVRLQQEEALKEHVTSQIQKSLEGAFKPEISVALPFSAPASISSMPLSFSAPPPLFPQPMLFEEEKEEVLFLFGSYIFVRREEEILVMDERRVRSFLFYEKVHVKKEKPHIQALLLPLIVEKTSEEAACIERHLPFLNEMGILLRAFGGGAFCIEGVPDAFSEDEVRALLDSLTEGDSERGILMRLCKGMRKKTLSLQEAKGVVRALFRCHAASAPDGKPLYFRLTQKEIEKWLA